MSPAWTAEVLDFWFARGWDDWWKPNPAFDLEIKERFCRLWEE